MKIRSRGVSILNTCLALAAIVLPITAAEFETPLNQVKAAARPGDGRPVLVSEDCYNAYETGGSPLGLLEVDLPSVAASLGYFFSNVHASDEPDSVSRRVNSVTVPALTIGQAGVAALKMYYNPGARYDAPLTTPAFELSLHRFGFASAAGTPAGIVQGGLAADGYYGKETVEGMSDRRVAMGLERVSVHLGSRLHELVRIGFAFKAAVRFDSLYDADAVDQRLIQEDRFVEGSLGGGGEIDVSREGFPVMSNFAIAYAKNRFSYVSRPIPPRDRGRQDPIFTDSLVWDWKTMVRIASNGMVYRPAFGLGYTTCDHQVFSPATGDLSTVDWFFRPEYQERPGQTWDLSSLRYGLGGEVSVFEYGQVWLEYWHSSFKAVFGSGFSNPGIDIEEGYDGYAFGLTGNIHRIPGMPFPGSMELLARLGFRSERENAGWEPYQWRLFREINQIGPNSQFQRYLPWQTLSVDRQVGVFSLGLGGRFLDGMFGIDLAAGFPTIKATNERNGSQFTVEAFYALRNRGK